ncbi:MAG: hypothetical protein MK077_02555 [Phycisphaerales bacterium]|nr:hypothetical protein [Phycisphaerales bacterium]
MIRRGLHKQLALALMVLPLWTVLLWYVNRKPVEWLSLQVSPTSSDPGTWRLLPGIGPVLAGRLAAAAPFQDSEALLAVEGIGEVTAAKLTPQLSWPMPVKPKP